MGPMPFQELVNLIRSGTLSRDSVVRREDDTEWQCVEDVVGLTHAARVETDETPMETMSVAHTQNEQQKSTLTSEENIKTFSEPSPTKSFFATKLDRRSIKWFVTTGAIVAAFLICWRWSAERARFPMPSWLKQQTSGEYFFIGTGPWSVVEYGILWFDIVLVTTLLSYAGFRWLRK